MRVGQQTEIRFNAFPLETFYGSIERIFPKAEVRNATAVFIVTAQIDNVDFTGYDVIFLAGGWGAAYDLGQSDILAEKISAAYYESDAIIGGVCHGPLGLVKAKDKDGNLLIAGRKMSGVTDKQIKELKIDFTPLHPESALRAAGAQFEASTAKKDLFATHTVVDNEGRFVTGQNQNSGHVTAHEMMRLAKATK